MKTKFNIALIDKLLAGQKLNRNSFAKKLKISRQLLSYYINNPTLKSIEIIADGLGLSAKDLLK
jgi:transcriptional regulator with PAS, ATPase and Fis domain